jgi:hypothetical protein
MGGANRLTAGLLGRGTAAPGGRIFANWASGTNCEAKAGLSVINA